MVRKYVPINEVGIHPLNIRMVRSKESIARLADSINQRGLEYPLKVVENPRGGTKYLCYDGGYRLEALKLAGKVQAWIEVEEIKDETSLIIRSFDMADKVVPVNPVEEARAFKTLMDKFRDPGKIAKLVGRDRKYITERLSLLNLSARVEKLIIEGKMTYLPAYQLSQYPKEVQNNALEIIEHRSHGIHESAFRFYDKVSVNRALMALLGKKERPLAKGPSKKNTPGYTKVDWICPHCNVKYRTYCDGEGRHSFERVNE